MQKHPTPLLAKLLKVNDIGMLPAIEWGRKHEEDAKKAIFSAIVSKHKHGKLLYSLISLYLGYS